jgi:hypothetical protein
LWNNHKRSISHKKEREGEHSSEHENDIERPTSTRRNRDLESQSQSHRRHTLSPRFDDVHLVDDHNEIIPKN